MSKKEKRRADQLLVERGLAETRSRAQALIMAGQVLCDDRPLEKAGQMVSVEVSLRLRGKAHPWVSRGGVKLAKGLEHFGVDPSGFTCLDVGASTGGFTDVLLQHGAAKVYAVDVGHGQLAWGLRQDPRVVVMERCNARYLTAEQVPDPIQLIVCDASFISLTQVLPAAMALAKPGAGLIALIKPQFEVGKGQVGKGGIVRDPAQHQAVCEKILAFLDGEAGWQVQGLTESPIKGPDGNLEFLVAAQRTRA